MSQQDIIIGAADEKQGDTYFSAFTKVQANTTEIYDRLRGNEITVKQSNIQETLGAPIDSTKVYFLDGIIDLTGSGISIEIPAGGIYINGYNFDLSGLKCSEDSYTLFTSPAGGSGNVLFNNFLVDLSGVGSAMYDIKSLTGNEAIEADKLNFNNCSSLGVIDNYRQGLEAGTGRFGGTPELTLKGEWAGGYFIETSIIRSLDDGAYSIFKSGAGFVMQSRFRSNMNMDLPASASFFDFAAANFPNSSTVQLDGCIISRGGAFDAANNNITPNMQPGDLSSAWSGNVGIRNTFVGGKQKVTAESATIISASSTFYTLNATWTPSNLSHFDSPSTGRLRHLGVSPIEFKVQANLTIEGTSGNEIAVRIKKWDDSAGVFLDFQPTTRQINAFVGGRDVAFFTITSGIVLDTNDFLLLQVANNSGNGNVTAELDSDFVVEER